MSTTRIVLWSLTALAALGFSLRGSGDAPPRPEVLATVDGVALTDIDLQLRLRPDHQKEAPGENPTDYRKKVLETIISQELAAQKARALGLDADPDYLRGLAPLEAQVAAYKRKTLAELYSAHEMKSKGGVSDAEARTFFEQHALRLRTQVQVFQVMRRSPEAIEQARAELAAAPSFEAWAKTQFPQLPETERPWDLGFLRWEQLPEQWRDVVYTMKKGELSPVIAGPKSRYWILMLVETREDPTVTFETVRTTLVEALKHERLLNVEQQTLRELREKATVVYAREP